MINKRTLELYGSGFLGITDVSDISEKPESGIEIKTADGIMSSLSILSKPSNEVKISTEIDAMHQHFYGRPHTLNIFRYQDEFLRLFLRTVKFKTPAEWLIAQQSSPMFTQTHKDFLIDLVRLSSGNRRQLAVYTWQSMLRNSPKERSLNKPGLTFEELGISPKTSWKVFIPNLLSTKGGLNDLVQTVWIMYGSGTIKE